MGLDITLDSESHTKEILREPKGATNNFFDGGYDFSAKVSNHSKSVEILNCINNLYPIKYETITATGIYYYDISKNVTNSRVKFRAMVNDPDYEQGEDRGVETVYGLVNEETLCQQLGSIDTIKDDILILLKIMRGVCDGIEAFENVVCIFSFLFGVSIIAVMSHT